MKNQRGAGVLEVLIASLLLILVILGTLHLFQKTTVSSVNIERSKNVAALAQMVFEQYALYAATQFALMGGKDIPTPQPIEAFFKRSLGPDYDGMTLTTEADYALHGSTCAITVEIYWTQGGETRKTAFTRMFVDNVSAKGGGIVEVTVIPACGTYTDRADIVNYCPKGKGFLLRANSYLGGEVTTLTASNGVGELNHVIIGDNIEITIKAPDPSPYFESANFQRGYYVWGPSNAPELERKVMVKVEEDKTTPLTNTDFLPAGIVKGNLTNGSGDEVIADVGVQLDYGAWVAHEERFKRCGVLITCGLKATASNDPAGTYFFGNVIPGLTSISLPGVAGSSPTVPTTHADFEWGYMGNASLSLAWDKSVANPPTATYNGLPPNLQIKKLGWLKVIVRRTNSSFVEKASVQAQLPALLPHRYGLNLPGIPPAPLLLTDANGEFMFHNVLNNNSQTFPFSGDKVIDGTTYYASLTFKCPTDCVGQETPVTLTLRPAYKLTALVVDDWARTSPARIENIIGETDQKPGVKIQGKVDDQGHFNLEQINLDYLQLMPNGSYNMTIRFSKDMGSPITVRLKGDVKEFGTGTPAAGAEMTMDPYGPSSSEILVTDEDGKFDHTIDLPWMNVVTVNMRCDFEPICTVSAGIPIDTSQAQTTIASSGNGWYVPANTLTELTHQSTRAGNHLNAFLNTVRAHGEVKKAGAGPLANIDVQSVLAPKYPYKVKTNAAGFYEFWMPVQGRINKEPGTIQVEVPPNQTVDGTKYQGLPFTYQLPTDFKEPLDPSQLPAISFSLLPIPSYAP